MEVVPVILKFPSAEARSDFLNRLEGDAATQSLRIKPSHTQPTVVTVRTRDRLTEQQLRSQLSPFLGPEVKVFEDVQFSPMI